MIFAMFQKENVLENKSFDFAVRIVRLYQYLQGEKKEFVMSKQLLRAGTSIVANAAEARGGESKLDFIHKLSLVQKENRETIFWLKLLHTTGYLSEVEYESINAGAIEIYKIVTSSLLTSKNKGKERKKPKSALPTSNK